MVSRRLTAAALPLVALLGACGEAGEVYPIPSQEVRQQLLASELPPVFGSYAPDVTVVHDGDGNIVWWVGQEGKPVLRFIARTEAVDEGHTRVTVDLKPATDSPDDPTAKRLEENPAVHNLYLAAMTEQVDATLERRTFDFGSISGAMMGAMGEQMGRMDEDFDRAVAAYGERDAANMAEAYAEEGQAGWSSESESEPAFGEPMDRPGEAW